MGKIVNVGLIGAGRIGQLHAHNLAFSIPDAEIVAATDKLPEAVQKCAAECGIANIVGDYHDILTAPDVEAVIICSPTNTHADLIVESARAGKHIFCEKPISLDLASIDAALSEVEKAGVKLQIGFNRRFDPGFKHAKDTVSAGKIGTPHLVRISSRDPEPPPLEYVKDSGGLFLDMTIHDFDMSRYLLDEEITEVYAVGNALINSAVKDAGDIDTAVITLTYESGAYCVIDNSREAVYGYDQRIEVFGSEGCIIIGNRQPYESTLYTRETVANPLPLHFFLQRYTESFLEEMHHFIVSIQEDAAPSVTGVDGRIPVEIGLAAQQSLESRQPVKLGRAT